MIMGIGIDIEEISRFKDEYVKKILSEEEKVIYQNKGIKKMEYLASRFSAKEALVKAFGHQLNYQEISILNDESGKPYVKMESEFLIHISLSHTDNLVISYIVLEKKE